MLQRQYLPSMHCIRKLPDSLQQHSSTKFAGNHFKMTLKGGRTSLGVMGSTDLPYPRGRRVLEGGVMWWTHVGDLLVFRF